MRRALGMFTVIGLLASGGCGKDSERAAGSSGEPATGVAAEFDQAKVEMARVEAIQLAREAYTMWQMENAGTPCPGSMDELLAFVDKNDAGDPWGNAYVMVCGGEAPGGFGVVSNGPDGQPGTADDVRSWP